MSFELVKIEGRYSKAEIITINSEGLIFFNVSFAKRYGLFNFKYAQFYYDKDSNKLGIKPINDNNVEFKRKLSFSKSRWPRWMGAKVLFNILNIKLPEKDNNYKFSPEVDNDGMIILDLNKIKEQKVKENNHGK